MKTLIKWVVVLTVFAMWAWMIYSHTHHTSPNTIDIVVPATSSIEYLGGGGGVMQEMP